MDRDSQEIECWKQLALLSERFHQDFNGRSKRAICNVWILIYPIIQSEPDVFEWRLEQYEFNACTWGLKVHIRADMPTLMVWGHFQVKSQKCLEDLQLTATAKLPWNLIFHPKSYWRAHFRSRGLVDLWTDDETEPPDSDTHVAAPVLRRLLELQLAFWSFKSLSVFVLYGFDQI